MELFIDNNSDLQQIFRDYQTMLRHYKEMLTQKEGAELEETRVELFTKRWGLEEIIAITKFNFNVEVGNRLVGENSKSSLIGDFTYWLQMFRRDLNQPVTFSDIPEFDEPLNQRLVFLEDAVFRLESQLNSLGHRVEPFNREKKKDNTDPVIAKAQTRVKTLQRLEEEMRRALESSPPEMRREIERIFREAKDEILDDSVF